MSDTDNKYTRREFLKTAGLTSLAVLPNTNPYANAFTKQFLFGKEDDVNGFDHYCCYIRPHDLMCLYFYFVNLRESGSSLKKIDGDKNAYMVVRLPQQHIGEELVINDSKLSKFPLRSFVSGFSYLSFKLKTKKRKIDYDIKYLTNWNNFELLTTQNITNYPADIPVELSSFTGNYPLNINNKVSPLFIETERGIKIPITIFEAPYKMFLSPIAPFVRPRRNELFQFTFSSKNQAIQYLKDTGKMDKKFELYELWNNNLLFERQKDSDLIEQLPPHFKVLAYSGSDKFDGKRELLPMPDHRKQLSVLTNIPEYNRDVISKYFNFSGLGASTYLEYENLDPKQESVVAWKQEIKLARDNYVEITFRAVDVNTGLKLLISLIAERKIKDGICYLNKRFYVKYLEREKIFNSPITIKGIPLAKITAKDKGNFCEFKQIKAGKQGYAVIKEYGTYPADLIRFNYTGIDRNGKSHELLIEIMCIPAEAYEITYGKYDYEVNGELKGSYPRDGKHININHIGLLNPEENNKPKGVDPEEGGAEYHYKIVKDFTPFAKKAVKAINESKIHKDNIAHHSIKFKNNKLAYAPNGLEIQNPTDQVLNTELPSESIILYSVVGGQFEDEFPILPRLHHANVYLPQLEAIESTPILRKVSYARSYLENGFDDNNKSQIFLKTLKNVLTGLSFQFTDENSVTTDEDDEDVFSTIEKNQEAVNDIFSNNYRNAGGMVNPDVVIEGVSALEQGITMAENLNNVVQDIKQVRPMDVLRGLNTEIFGGIDLKTILKELLPIEDSPIFKVVEQAEEGLGQLQFLADNFQDKYKRWQKEHDTYKGLIRELPARIKEEENRLLGIAKGELQNFIDRYNAKMEELEKIEVYIKEFNPHRPRLYEYIYNNSKELVKVIYGKLKDDLGDQLEAIDTFLISNMDAIKEFLKAVRGDPVQGDQPAQVFKLVNISTSQGRKESLKKLFYDHFDKIKGSTNDLKKARFVINNVLYKITEDINTDDLFPLFNLLQEIGSELKEEHQAHFQLYLDSINEVYRYTKAYYENKKNNLEADKNLIKKQIENKYDQMLQAIESNEALRLIKQNAVVFHGYYNELKGIVNEAELVSVEIGVNISKEIEIIKGKFKGYESLITGLLKEEYGLLRRNLEVIMKGELGPYKELIDSYEDQYNNLRKDILRNYNSYREQFGAIENEVQKKVDDFKKEINKSRQEVVNQIKKYKEDLKNAENYANNFIKNKLKELENEYREKNKELIAQIEAGVEDYNELKKEVENTYTLIKKLKEVNKKEINYTWKTNNIRDFSLGPISFIAGNDTGTELDVKVNSTVYFDIKFDSPPRIKKQEIYTKNKLTNFGLSFFGIITVQFDEVSIVGGSEVKEEFNVEVRDVAFDGALNFVEVFQNFLTTLDKGLTLDIDAHGARLGYLLPLPSISGGAFNFVNVMLSMELMLPFKSGVPMQFIFGLNNPRNMFLLSVTIFGGRGCFQIMLEPKRGVVGIRLVIEFGAVLYFGFAGAEGFIYLFAGIYYEKRYDTVKIKGYIVAGGCLNILSLITASITFYLGLEGNGKYLKGKCRVIYSFKILFKEFTTELVMEKTVHGAPDNSSLENRVRSDGTKTIDYYTVSDGNSAKFPNSNEEIEILEGTLKRTSCLCVDEPFSLKFKFKHSDRKIMSSPMEQIRAVRVDKDKGLSELDIDFSVNKLSGIYTLKETTFERNDTGAYELRLFKNNREYYNLATLTVVKDDDDRTDDNNITRREWKAYFKSYYL